MHIMFENHLCRNAKSPTTRFVPAYAAANLAGMPWLDYPMVVGANLSEDLYKEGKVYFPVRNNSFSVWQQRHARGGDFIILSDSTSIRLERPIEVPFS